MTFRIRQAQQDHLSRNLVGTDLAKSLARLSKDAFFNADEGQVCIVGARDQRSYLELDAKGRVVKMTTPLGRVSQLAFNDGRLAHTLQPTGLAMDFAKVVTTSWLNPLNSLTPTPRIAEAGLAQREIANTFQAIWVLAEHEGRGVTPREIFAIRRAQAA